MIETMRNAEEKRQISIPKSIGNTALRYKRRSRSPYGNVCSENGLDLDLNYALLDGLERRIVSLNW